MKHTHTKITIQIDTPYIVHTRTLYNTHYTTYTTVAAFLTGLPSTLSQHSTLNSRAKHTHSHGRQYPTTATTSSINLSCHFQEDKKEKIVTHKSQFTKTHTTPSTHVYTIQHTPHHLNSSCNLLHWLTLNFKSTLNT